MSGFSYSHPLWRAARDRAFARDGCRCSVARLLGGRCSAGALHAHHLIPVGEGGDPYDLENLLTVCAAHHPQLEGFRRALLARLRPVVRCPHAHRSADAREVCEARLARERQLVA